MKGNFDSAWWMSDQNLYVDSLCNSVTANPDPSWTNYCRRAGQQLQQKHWINATPMETLLAPNVAPDNRATTALTTLESPTFIGDCGLYHTGVGGGPDGSGEQKCWTLTIGHALPAGATVKSVTLVGKPTTYNVVDTSRGREVHVETLTGSSHTLVVTTG